jgi:hypothetical protein
MVANFFILRNFGEQMGLCMGFDQNIIHRFVIERVSVVEEIASLMVDIKHCVPNRMMADNRGFEIEGNHLAKITSSLFEGCLMKCNVFSKVPGYLTIGFQVNYWIDLKRNRTL